MSVFTVHDVLLSIRLNSPAKRVIANLLSDTADRYAASQSGGLSPVLTVAHCPCHNKHFVITLTSIRNKLQQPAVRSHHFSIFHCSSSQLQHRLYSKTVAAIVTFVHKLWFAINCGQRVRIISKKCMLADLSCFLGTIQ